MAFQRFSRFGFSLIFDQQQPANHYLEQPRYYTFLAGHPEPSAPLPDDFDDRANQYVEREVFNQYDDDDDFDIDLVDTDHEKINIRKRARSPPPQHQQNRPAIPKRRLLRQKVVLYEESSSSSCSSSRKSSSSDSYEIDSFVEEDDDEQVHGLSSYSGPCSYSDDECGSDGGDDDE